MEEKKFKCKNCGFQWDYQATRKNECPNCNKLGVIQQREN